MIGDSFCHPDRIPRLPTLANRSCGPLGEALLKLGYNLGIY